MGMTKGQNEFLGAVSAIVVATQEQFEKLREWLAIKNKFLSDGTPVTQLNVQVNKPIAFYIDMLGSYVGYGNVEDIERNYNIISFNDAFMEQRNLFGGDDAPGIRPPEDDLVVDPMEDDVVEAEYKEVENEISLKEALNQLTIGSITPAKCDGNLLEIKDKVIEVINKKENIVITRDNFVESKEVVKDLNSKVISLKEQRASFNREVKKFTEPYSNAFSEVINALENVSNKLKSSIKVFEEQEKEASKQKLFDKIINPMLNMLVEKKMLDEDTKALFEFNKSWTNASALTKTGNLTKKTENEINAELERLVNLYQQKINDIETIKSAVVQLASAHGLDAQLKADTYIELYKKGSSMPEVQQRINHDVEMIKNAVQKEAVKKAQEIVSNQHKEQHEQSHKVAENTSPTQEKQSNITILTDDKTGVVLVKGNEQQILASIVSTPDKYAEKTFEYTYSFSGSFGTIKTFSNILKLLSMMFKDFKYERK